MLACIQRRQGLSSQRLSCQPKSLNVPPPALQPCTLKGDPGPAVWAYPSPAQLDAFAMKTANSPLSIKIFPTDVRVPQHKQLSRTVNGLDTSGAQRYGPYSHPCPGGYQGLLAVVKATAAVRGLVKNSEGRRTKHANAQTSAPFLNPLSVGCSIRHKAFPLSSCEPAAAAAAAAVPGTGMASGDPSLAPRSELAEVHGLMRQMGRVPRGQPEEEARGGPSPRAVAAVARSDSDFAPGVPPQSGPPFPGAVPPAQGADKAGHPEQGRYAAWRCKPPIQPAYQQGAGGMYGAAVGRSPDTRLPLACASQLHYGLHPLGVEATQGEFSVRQYLAPLWDNAVATPNSDCYASQVLASGPGDLRLHHPRLYQQRQPQLQLAFGSEPGLCCAPPPPPPPGLLHAAALSSSLQSLECLISEIHPPCIKERMLGRGFEAAAPPPPPPEHQQRAHLRLPVYR